MKRFEVLYSDNSYEIVCDTYNKMYAVFVKCNYFSQQKSKWYIREYNARKYLTRLMSL